MTGAMLICLVRLFDEQIKVDFRPIGTGLEFKMIYLLIVEEAS